MTEVKNRRPRGASPRGNFETAKTYAVSSEEARLAAERRKTEALRQARLRQQLENHASDGK